MKKPGYIDGCWAGANNRFGRNSQPSPRKKWRRKDAPLTEKEKRVASRIFWGTLVAIMLILWAILYFASNN